MLDFPDIRCYNVRTNWEIKQKKEKHYDKHTD